MKIPSMIEVFRLVEDQKDTFAEAGEQLKVLLTNSELSLVPLLINPPMFPDREANKIFKDFWSRYVAGTGWVIKDEHLPVFNEKHWNYKFNDAVMSSGGEPLSFVEDMLSFLHPKTEKAQMIKNDPSLALKIYSKFEQKLQKLNAAVGDSLTIGVLGSSENEFASSTAPKTSSNFKAAAKSVDGEKGKKNLPN